MNARPLVGLLASLGALAALGQQAPQSAGSASGSSASTAAAKLPAGGAGVRAYLDADGRLGEAPPGGGRQPQTAPPSRNYALMWTEPMPDGGVLLHTEGQVQMASMARIGADGRIEQFCAPAARPSSAADMPAAATPADAAR